MGRIARVIENIKNRVNMNLGGEFNNECENSQPSGDDARPLVNDEGITNQWGKSGRWAVLGFFDYSNKIALPGEKRIYGRSLDGTVTSHVHLKNDGTIEIMNDGFTATYKPDGTKTETNGAYNLTVSPSGSVNINGLIIGVDGSVISPVSVAAPSIVVNGKEMKNHTHPAGSPPGNTGVNN